MSASTLHRRAGVFSELLATCAVVGLLGLAMLTTVDVLLRYLFASPIRGLVDVSALMAAVLLSACMPYVVTSRGNIMIDFLGRLLGGRFHRGLNLFGAIVTTAFFALLAWQCIRFAIDMKNTGEVMAILRWPVWPWWALVAAFIVLTTLVALATLFEEKEAA
ncbi:TRAP transporter small permease [Pusillimonas caeni]|uniref:TRAP transporter small permease n=1 Tax=Pusillimonas caeni TaxID=1348472 RepID=UPI000E59C91A|nr:TRAP transporter small permease [Pusillimonas caeni]TFL14514.1 TRAP transporter small permease [Pusillimonas caeni]